MTDGLPPAHHLLRTVSHCPLPGMLHCSHQTPGTRLLEEQPSRTPVPLQSCLWQDRFCSCWPRQPQPNARLAPHRLQHTGTAQPWPPSSALHCWHAGVSFQGSVACMAPVTHAVSGWMIPILLATALASCPILREPLSLSDTGRAQRVDVQLALAAAPGGKAVCLSLPEAQTRTKYILKALWGLLLTCQLSWVPACSELPCLLEQQGREQGCAPAAASPLPLLLAPLLQTSQPHSLLPPGDSTILTAPSTTHPPLSLM